MPEVCKYKQLIDSHTYTIKPYSIINIDPLNNFSLIKEIPVPYCFSVGYHPWKADSININDIKPVLIDYIQKFNIVALGECGLDRYIKTDLKIQTNVFIKQLALAEELNLPVIIHSVRSWSDMFPIFSEFRKTTFILHDFRGNRQQVSKLLEFHTYFSFGKSLYWKNQKTTETILQIPDSRLLIETDDLDISIENIFNKMFTLVRYNKFELEEKLIENTIKAYKLKFL